MLRFGLCCQFRKVDIKFKNTTLTHILSMDRRQALEKLSTLCRVNANALFDAISYCITNDIKAFRVNSQILPIKSHPMAGYDIHELPDGDEIKSCFFECGSLARSHSLRLSFHPDQFVVLNSPNKKVVEQSVRELEYHGEVAEWIGADTINVHLGGAYDDKPAAMRRFTSGFDRLSDRVQQHLTLENDDKIYTPKEILPLCKELDIPLVYDVHHHRCNPDGMSIEEITDLALATWNREALFHISSPLEGWGGAKPHRHADYIDARDFPHNWLDLSATIEVEAKAKELAVFRLMQDLNTP